MPKLEDLASGRVRRPRVLVLSKSFPNNVFDVLGLWVQNAVRHSLAFCEPKVISPVPYCPPLPGLPDYYARLRNIPLQCSEDGVEVFHPRYLIGPGYSLRSIEGATYYLAARRRADPLRREFPFDLIHAHFTYPDGYAAVRLGQRFQVPVVVTEHVPWGPWMDTSRIVLRQSVRAVRECTLLVAVSTSVRDSILRVVSAAEKMRVIPNAVDGAIFAMPAKGQRPIGNQIIFVGAIRPVKGVDILLRATRLLVESGREVKLLLVGESFFKNYQRQHEVIRRMTQELDLGSRVQFVGKRHPPELVRYIQESAVLVLPSRAESFGMVLVEALACGTPVVATRCGGPEDIVTEKVGILVPPEDPQALAAGIAQVLDRRGDYDPLVLRSHALQHFGLDSVGDRVEALYDEALERFAAPPSNSNHGL
jgi:teichuronic acid biosynthesis glycosyltransferase TuaC